MNQDSASPTVPAFTFGSCLCGKVRFEVTLPPKWFQYCHCESCRKTTSSAFAANLIFPPENFRWIAGEALIKRYVDEVNNPGYRRWFCGDCGSAVPRPTRTEQWYVVQAGLLDSDPVARPDCNIYWSERPEWLPSAEDLPKRWEGRDSELVPENLTD